MRMYTSALYISIAQIKYQLKIFSVLYDNLGLEEDEIGIDKSSKRYETIILVI